jgi:sulfur relay (sulfurtransferase) complex TusBCD TusD component (DsrE family)
MANSRKEKLAADKSDGLQCCAKCQFKRGLTCDERTMKVCSVKYREGFLRGSAWQKRQNSNNK